MKKLTVVTLLATSIISSCAFAGTQSTPMPTTKVSAAAHHNPNLPKLLYTMQKQGYFTVIASKKVTELKHITAVMVRSMATKEYFVYWIDNTQQSIFTGDLVTKDGSNLTTKYRNALLPSQAETFKKVFNHGLVLSDNHVNHIADDTFYMFFEPHCHYCHDLHRKLKPFIKKGLKVQYIPVAWLANDSYDLIATMKASKNVTDAIFHADADLLPVKQKADDALRAKVEANADIMKQMGIGGTPGVVYMNDAGKVVVGGVINDDQLYKLVHRLMAKNTKK